MMEPYTIDQQVQVEWEFCDECGEVVWVINEITCDNPEGDVEHECVS